MNSLNTTENLLHAVKRPPGHNTMTVLLAGFAFRGNTCMADLANSFQNLVVPSFHPGPGLCRMGNKIGLKTGQANCVPVNFDGLEHNGDHKY